MSFWRFSFSASHLVRGTLGYALLYPAFTWVLRFKLGSLCLHTKCFIYWAISPSFFWNLLKISRCFSKLGEELCACRYLPSQHLKSWAEVLCATLLGCMYGLVEQFLYREIHTKIRTHFSISLRTRTMYGYFHLHQTGVETGHEQLCSARTYPNVVITL